MPSPSRTSPPPHLSPSTKKADRILVSLRLHLDGRLAAMKRPKYVIHLGLTLIILLALFRYETAISQGLQHVKVTVSEGKVVSLEYTLTLDDTSVVESNVGKTPLTYTQGSHQVIPGLEKALEGMAVGDT